jgi:hypothetical protein
VLGSIWGVMEIYGVEVLNAMAVPHKSPFLFAFAVLIMYAAKRISDFPGSSVAIALIAAVYKTMSFSLPACGSNVFVAIIIDGVFFEVYYQVAKTFLAASTLKRTASGLILPFGAFILFGLYATYINPENAANGGNFHGLIKYISSSGIYAAFFTALTINIGFVLGNAIGRILNPEYSPKVVNISKAVGLVYLFAAWAVRLRY